VCSTRCAAAPAATARPAIRRFVFYHGVWDVSELYDLRADPQERFNLANVPALQDTVRAMRARLFDRLERSGGMQVPIRRGDWAADQRLLHPARP
jgi:N-acetylglucosamine-6-sulfatase